MMMSELEERTQAVNQTLEKFLMKEEGWEKTIYEGMNYSILAGGKRLRPLMVKEMFLLFGGNDIKEIEPFMAAIEMVHTYSLVHDDLPAMDNDDYRRGKLTTHKKYGEDMGILVGDALLNCAFETALEGISQFGYHQRGIEALAILSKKAGSCGMIGGQVVDVQASGHVPSVEQLIYLYEKKTSCLIEAAMMMGSVMAGASNEQVLLVEKAASCIGIAFQIQDDILDVVGDEDIIGKPVNSDAKNEKTTYVTLCGLDKAKEAVNDYTQQAVDILEQLPGDKTFMLSLVNALINRQK